MLAAAASLTISATAAAQPLPVAPVALPRFDLHGAVGWQNLHKEDELSEYNDWLNDIFYAGAGSGWYWTEHLKTQVDLGAGTRGERYSYEQISANGQIVGPYRLRVRQTSVAIGQQYQFFRNQWFHPHAGLGLEIARETSDREYQPTFGLDPVTRTTRQIAPARHEGPDHDVIARPFAEVGFKGYLSRRAFFTSDMRVMFRGGVDQVLFRFGFGVDF